MVKITDLLLNQLIEYCRLQLPNEACGVLFGSNLHDSIVVHSYKTIANIAALTHKQFQFDPQQFLNVLYSGQAAAWIGIFHSHPASAASPSYLDLHHSWNLPIYMIISFETPDNPIMKSYEILPHKQKKPYSFKEQTIEISGHNLSQMT